MQHFVLSLFARDAGRYELRIVQLLEEQARSCLPQPVFVAQANIDLLLAQAQTDYRHYAADLAGLGRALFAWIDRHSGGWLRGLRQTPQSTALSIDVSVGGLGQLPWELLHDGNDFLCADPVHWFTPIRRVSTASQPWQPQLRQLSMLFMASSPEGVTPVLNYEAEEAHILQATRRHPMALLVEESGTLAGLQQRLEDMAEPPDMLHLSGHADVDANGPLFLLEDELGRPAPATPVALARTLRQGGELPRLVFLSGCRTGQADAQRDAASFAEQLVRAGVPLVLGWALPVGDSAASAAAAALYGKLATGFGAAEAVASARQQLLEAGSSCWHLLRCYSDASPPRALVAKGLRPARVYDTRQAFLDAGGRLPVCARADFIGRRRLLQRCLRHLRALPGDADYREGVLLHGMGGQGKSSAAARLVDRLRGSHQPVVCYGGLDEAALIGALAQAFPQAAILLNTGQLSLAQRLAGLFDPEANPYTGGKSILLVFDDFEQNASAAALRRGDIEYSADSLRTLNAVLRGIRDSHGDVRAIVTSRYQLAVAEPCRLHAEMPPSLRDADLQKKLAQLPGLLAQAADVQTQAVELAAGNPRLLEWLDKALPAGSGLDAAALLAALAAKAAEFRESILVRALYEAQPAAVRQTVARAAIYRLPQPLAAIAALAGDDDCAQALQHAAGFGLVEILTDSAGAETYFVSALLAAELAEELTTAERQDLSGQAARYLDQASSDAEFNAATAGEILRLAEAGGEHDIAVATAHRLAVFLYWQNRYREAEALCLRMLGPHPDFRILTTLAQAEQRLGRPGFAERIAQAVALLPAERGNL